MKKLFIYGFLAFFLISFLSGERFMPVHAEEQGSAVSAVVPPGQNDYQFSFASDGQTNVPQNTTLNYTVTYGNRASSGIATTTTIVADFSDDLAPGGSDVLDYVIGSASSGYGGVLPIVDLDNRTLTWIIPNLPSGTIGQTLTFQLRTNENYTGPALVNFTTKTAMSNQYLTMPDQTITQGYQFNPGLVTPTPTPTNTPTPTAAPTPTPTPGISPTGLPGPTATPKPQPTATKIPTPSLTISPTQPENDFQITDVSFNAISQSSADIAITTNKPANEQIRFGTSPLSLSQTIQTNQPQTSNILHLSDLLPSTKYYFQITATDADGNVIRSELFTFTTAEKSQPPQPSNAAVVITSGGNVVVSGSLNPTSLAPFGTLTTDTDYQLTYSFDNDPRLKNLEIIVRNSDGIDRVIHMNQKDLRTFTANLRSGGSGTYEVVIRMTDENGNVTEQTVARIKVLNRFIVLEKDTSMPIGDARIFLSVYNPATNHFDPLSDVSFGWLKNPSFTNSMGELQAVLPNGRYQAQVSAFGYDGETVAFTIGEAAGQNFPTVYLRKDIFNLTALFNYVKDVVTDIWNNIQTFSKSLASSVRFYNSVATVSLFSIIGLGFMLFKIRTGIEMQHLAPFMLLSLFTLMNKHREQYLHGFVLSEENIPIGKVRIEVMDAKTNTILTHVVTTNNGKFAIRNTFPQSFIKLIVIKEALSEQELVVATDTRKDIVIHMVASKHQTPILIHGIEQLAGRFFESILVLALLAELFFLPAFGWAKTLPFFALSLCNLLLWIFYLKEKHLT